MGRVGADEGDGGLVGVVAEAGVERREGAAFFVLGEAAGELAGLAEGGHVAVAGSGAADVHQAESEGAADAGVGAMPRSERSPAGGDGAADVAGRSIDDDHGAHPVGGRLHVADVELGIAHCSDGGEYDGEVLGSATGHDGVDRSLLDGGLAGTDLGDDDIGLEFDAGEHRFYAVFSRDNDRQAVGPLMHVEEFERGRLVGGLMARRAQFHRLRPSSRSMMPGAASRATRARFSSPVPEHGCGKTQRGTAGMPTASAVKAASSTKASVTIATEGRPALAKIAPSRTVPDVQPPQCPQAARTTSHSSVMTATCSSVTGATLGFW